MARRCGPTKPCGMSQGLFNPFFQNGAPWMGGGSTTDPTSFPNLEYWYDPSQLTGYIDGQEIVSLLDFSGKNKTLTPLGGTATRRPHFKTNAINGLPSITFDGGDNLVGTKVDFDFMHHGDSTLFWLIKPTTNDITRYFFSSSENSLANVGRTIRHLTSNEFNDTVSAAASPNNVFTFTTTNDALPLNQWSLIVVRYESNKTGDDAELYINNNAPLTNQGTAAPSALTSTANPTFFSLASGSAGFIGEAATWFGYSRALSNSEINTICGGLGFGV